MRSQILRIGSKKKARRGMVGIEAAIVLIAFVIVAAALAFVVLNMGFFTTQKSKEAMSSGLKEASTALEVDGSVLGKVANNTIAYIAIPLKTSTGKNPVDLNKVAITIKTPTEVRVYSGSDITIIKNASNDNPFTEFNNSASGAKAAFIEYQGDGDNLLEVNEKWVLVVDTSDLSLSAYTVFTIEIKPAVGAPLTVERMVPPQLSETIVELE